MSDFVGRRPTMEDTFAVCPRLGGIEGREAFAIFDGHAGR
jgi:serine/threonine protein phosphatase PrpC